MVYASKKTCGIGLLTQAGVQGSVYRMRFVNLQIAPRKSSRCRVSLRCWSQSLSTTVGVAVTRHGEGQDDSTRSDWKCCTTLVNGKPIATLVAAGPSREIRSRSAVRVLN